MSIGAIQSEADLARWMDRRLEQPSRVNTGMAALQGEVEELKKAPPRCKARRDTVFLVPNEAWTAVPLTTEDYDTDDLHAPNSHLISIPDDGLWLVTAQVSFNPTALGSYRGLRILATALGGVVAQTDADPHAITRRLNCSAQIVAGPGAVFMEAYQDVGTGLNLTVDGGGPSLAVARIG